LDREAIHHYPGIEIGGTSPFVGWYGNVPLWLRRKIDKLNLHSASHEGKHIIINGKVCTYTIYPGGQGGNSPVSVFRYIPKSGY